MTLNNKALITLALDYLIQVDRTKLTERDQDRLASAEMKLAIIECGGKDPELFQYEVNGTH